MAESFHLFLSIVDQSNTDAMSTDTPLSEITMIPAPMPTNVNEEQGKFVRFSFFSLSKRCS